MKGQRIFTAEEMRRLNLNKRISEPYPFTKEDHQNAPGFCAREARLWNKFFGFGEADFIARYTKEEHQQAEGFDAHEVRRWNNDFIHEHINNPVTESTGQTERFRATRAELYTQAEYEKSPGVEQDKQKQFSRFECQVDVDSINARVKTQTNKREKIKL